MTDRRTLLTRAAKLSGLAAAWGLSSAFRLEAVPRSYIQGHVESDDPTWDLLNNLELSPSVELGAGQAQFPANLQRLVGKPFTVRGFLLQLDANPYLSHFVVTRRNSSCAFCPPNGPGDAVEVFTNRRIACSAHEYEATGTLALFRNPSSGLYYRLTNARVRRFS